MEKLNNERLETRDLKGAINEHELKVNQRLEMLREGHKIEYNMQKWEFAGEEESESKKVRLRMPGTEIIVEMPVEMLAEEDLKLIQEVPPSGQ